MTGRMTLPTLVAICLISILTVVLISAHESTAAKVTVDHDWVVNTTIKDPFTDNEYVMRANLTVLGTGQASFRRCKFTFMSTSPGLFGILVKPGGYLLADTSTFSAGELSPGVPASAWTFHVQDSGRLSLQACQITDLGVTGGAEPKRGLAIESDNVRIAGSTFRNCNRAIVVMSSAYPSLEDNILEENQVGIEVTGNAFRQFLPNEITDNGIGIQIVECDNAYIYGGSFSNNNFAFRIVMSTVLVESVTIGGISNAVKAEFDSQVTLLNCTIYNDGEKGNAAGRSTINFHDCEATGFSGFTGTDANSNIHVRNSIQFKVAYKGADMPVADVNVELNDAMGTKEYQQVTDIDGLTPWVQQLIYQHKGLGLPEMETPFQIVASEGYNYVEIEGFVPGRYEFTLIDFEDSLFPELAVIEPATGAIYNTSEVVFRGRASDQHSGLAKLYYTIDGGDPQDLPLMDLWQATVELTDGVILIEFSAEDLVGNRAFLTRTVVVDTVPPTIEDIEPSPGSLTRAFSLLVTGTTEPGTTVTYGGNGLDVADNGTFSGYVNLGDEEGNQAVVFELTDLAGNVKEFLYNVMVDRTEPELVVETNPDHRDFPILNTSAITVFGSSEPNTHVQVFLDDGLANETWADGEGKWMVVIELSLGENNMIVDAFDQAGNRKSVEVINFLLDQSPPDITVLAPANGTVVKRMTVMVEVRTESDTAIWVNEEAELIMPLHGTVEFEVPLEFVGDNPLHIFARDQAGNVKQVIVHVVREEKKDNNGGNSPGPGPLLAVLAITIIAGSLAAVAGVRKMRS